MYSSGKIPPAGSGKSPEYPSLPGLSHCNGFGNLGTVCVNGWVG